jgi:hypothetical protein
MPKKKTKVMKPAGPEQFVPVQRKSKPHFRRGRGTIKEATLNTAMQSQADAVKQSMPGARRIIAALEDQMEGMRKGSLQASIGARMAKELRQLGYINYSSLIGLEAQKDQPLMEMFRGSYQVERLAEEAKVRINITTPRGDGVSVRSELITGFKLMAVMLVGNPLEGDGLEKKEVSTGLYPVKGKAGTTSLELPVPEVGVPWMLWLKLVCMEGPEVGLHPMYKRMRVVAVGR